MGQQVYMLIWDSFKKSYGPLGIVISIILWVIAPNDKISLKIVLPIFLLLVLLLITFIDSTINAMKQKNVLPKILRVINTNSNQVLFLIEKSPLFSYGIIVGIYFMENGFEQCIGVGKVLNIQEDGKIQVQAIYFLGAHEDIKEKLLENNKMYMEKTLIKPNIPYILMDTVGGILYESKP